MKHTWLKGFVLLCCLEVGCSTERSRLEADETARLAPGQTREEVRSILGVPRRSERDSVGRSLDIFWMVLPRGRASANLKDHNRTWTVRSAFVVYDPQGRVEKVTRYTGQSKGYDWRQDYVVGRWLTPEELGRVVRGQTTREELVRLWGSPTIQGLTLKGETVLSWISVTGKGWQLHRGQEFLVLLDGDSMVRDYRLLEFRP